MYADDMAVLDSDVERLKKFVTELDVQLCNAGMKMNVKKTKMMVLNGEMKEPIMIRGEKIEVEDSSVFGGTDKGATHSSCDEVAPAYISKAVNVFRAMYHQLWKRK